MGVPTTAGTGSESTGMCVLAELMAPGMAALSDPSEQLPRMLIDLMRDIGIPNGIGAVGYTAMSRTWCPAR